MMQLLHVNHAQAVVEDPRHSTQCGAQELGLISYTYARTHAHTT